MDFKPHCLATGIGSLPHYNAADAVEFTTSYFPDIPYWPQLPARGVTERFLNQFLNPLVELGVIMGQEDKYYVNTDSNNWVEALTRFYERYLVAIEGDEEAIQLFKLPEGNAAGFYELVNHMQKWGPGNAKYIKGQIFGPSLGLYLPDQNGKPAYYNSQFRDILIKTLALECIFQVKTLSQFGLPVMIFVDDGSIALTGGILSVERNEVLKELNELFEVIQGAGALAGFHLCAAGDWSILFDSKVDIVSFDAYGYFNTVSPYFYDIKNYLNRGGVLAWGIVPTSPEKVKGENVNSLGQRLLDYIQYLGKKGIDSRMVLNQSLITPSCGTGMLSMEAASRIHQLARDLSTEIKRINNLITSEV